MISCPGCRHKHKTIKFISTNFIPEKSSSTTRAFCNSSKLLRISLNQSGMFDLCHHVTHFLSLTVDLKKRMTWAISKFWSAHSMSPAICLHKPVTCQLYCNIFDQQDKTISDRSLGQSYHHDVILQLAAADGQMQVSHGSQPVLQRGAAIIYHIFHRKVVCRGPALVVLVPVDGIRPDAGSWIYIRQVRAQPLQINTASLLVAGVTTYLSALVTRYTSVNNWRLMRSPKRYH